MTDIFTKEKRSEIMSRIKNQSTIEILPVQFRGLYLRKHPEGIEGRPDFGNKTRRIALFIDGCFWHGCPEHYRPPKSNRKYWIPKIRRNRVRDELVTRRLKSGGWTVIRIWEHGLKNLK